MDALLWMATNAPNDSTPYIVSKSRRTVTKLLLKLNVFLPTKSQSIFAIVFIPHVFWITFTLDTSLWCVYSTRFIFTSTLSFIFLVLVFFLSTLAATRAPSSRSGTPISSDVPPLDVTFKASGGGRVCRSRSTMARLCSSFCCVWTCEKQMCIKRNANVEKFSCLNKRCCKYNGVSRLNVLRK